MIQKKRQEREREKKKGKKREEKKDLCFTLHHFIVNRQLYDTTTQQRIISN
jgi:hypothetical protein